MNQQQLRLKIIQSLNHQGFTVNGHILPTQLTKNHYKQIQVHSKKEQLNLQRSFLNTSLPKIKKYLLNGWDVNPYEIDLELRLIEPGSIEETLFRWWNLIWWSVPYQKAYGRQIRLILWDKTHNAPFGLIGLQSPILKMAVRDNHLKIPKDSLDFWINKSMQAQRLGALPPYNQLIGGKMVALALTSNELRNIYKEKYKSKETILQKRIIDSDLLFLTTTSAFGKSSIYNRLKYDGEFVAQTLGYTRGSGTFHVPQELYKEIQKFLNAKGIDTNTTFGYGPSRKVKLLDKALVLLGLRNYHYHNIQREYFLFPLVNNLKDVINKNKIPCYYDRPINDLINFWRQRWCLPRFERTNGWLDFDAEIFFKDIEQLLINNETKYEAGV